MLPLTHPESVRIRQIHDMAVKEFATHQVTSRLEQGMFRSWRVQKPGSWMYGFDVTTTPGCIIIAGDIGFLAMERDPDMLEWARKAQNDLSYMAQKVPHEIRTREYDPNVAEALLKEWVEMPEYQDDDYEDLQDFVAYNDFSDEHAVHEAISLSGICDGADFPCLTNWASSFLWCVEGLRFFLSRIPEPT